MSKMNFGLEEIILIWSKYYFSVLNFVFLPMFIAFLLLDWSKIDLGKKKDKTKLSIYGFESTLV